MADFLSFNEGENYVGQNGLPATFYFLLSTKSVDATSPFAATDTLATNGDGEITGTGYTRQSQLRPTPTNGLYSCSVETWTTGAATDWPAAVRSVVLTSTSDDSGVMVCAWNLVTGGAARDMSAAATTENVTVSVQIGTA